MKNLKLAVTALILIAAITACRSKQQPMPTIQAGSERVTIPFQNFRADANHFRAVNQGNSVDYAMARRIALQNARTELASTIEATVKAVTEQYADQ